MGETLALDMLRPKLSERLVLRVQEKGRNGK